MIKVNETPIYSVIDIVNMLNKVDSDEAYEFASELTGLSVDKLAEMVNE